MSLQIIALPPKSGQSPEWVMVLLHGWGANAADLSGLATFWDLPHYSFIFPQAPHPHPQISNGWMWYDIPADLGPQADAAGLPASRALLQDFLTTLPQTTGVPLARTVLAGFSQGGAMTLDLGLEFPLAALVVFSGFLHSNPRQASHRPPVFMAHGQQDLVVPLVIAQMAHRQLTQANVPVTFQEYPIGHEISPAVLQDSQAFLKGLSAPS
jgi:phospholipase/carboxylesterase